MRPFYIVGIGMLGVVALVIAGIWMIGCSLRQPTPGSRIIAKASGDTDADNSSDKIFASAAVEPPPAVVRVGGDLRALTTSADGQFRAGECRITTPLPAGYPEPTPPGAMELKRYPLVRRAEIGGTMGPDWGMNFAFFPLFNHIKRRNIAMTSPVEMNYEGLGTVAADKPTSWTMSFVYRSPEQGPAGTDSKDQRVLIEDIPPMTVVAIGMRGPYGLQRVKAGLAELQDWLSQQSEWEQDGDPRALFYNGPDVAARDLWSEVQLPLRRR